MSYMQLAYHKKQVMCSAYHKTRTWLWKIIRSIKTQYKIVQCSIHVCKSPRSDSQSQQENNFVLAN